MVIRFTPFALNATRKYSSILLSFGKIVTLDYVGKMYQINYQKPLSTDFKKPRAFAIG